MHKIQFWGGSLKLNFWLKWLLHSLWYFKKIKGFDSTFKINQIDITSNEWDAAKREGDKYFIYLVNNALNNEIKIFEMINNPPKLVDENSIDISTSVYELKLWKNF